MSKFKHNEKLKLNWLDSNRTFVFWRYLIPVLFSGRPMIVITKTKDDHMNLFGIHLDGEFMARSVSPILKTLFMRHIQPTSAARDTFLGMMKKIIDKTIKNMGDQ